MSSADVTRRALSLGDRDDVTGWYAKSFNETTIKMIILQKGSSIIGLPAGNYAKYDFTGFTANTVLEGDQIIDSNDTYYEIETVEEIWWLDTFSHYVCNLTKLPLVNLTGGTYSPSSVEDARYRNKVYLETYLDTDALPNFIVAYGEPDYSLVRVFKEKSVDLVFCISEPNSDPLIDSDHYPIGYKEHVPITISCIDKDNIEGTKLMWQAEAELRRVTETYPEGSLRALSARRPQTKRLGRTVLYSAEYIMEYERDTD